MSSNPDITSTDLLTALHERGYRVSQRLPSERQMTEMLGISRHQLRLLLEDLEERGLIWRHVGKGTYLGSRPDIHAAGAATLVAAVTNPEEVMEARIAIEPKLAALAAPRATRDEVDSMRYFIQKGCVAISISEYERWDGKFHQTIAEAARSRLLLTFFNVINAARDEALWGSLKQRTLTRERRATYNDHHESILDAILQRRADHAQSLMKEHLLTVQNDLRSAMTG